MPTIQQFPVELDLGNGTTQRLAATTCKVYSVAGGSDVATVTTNSEGIFPATTVGGAAGDLFRIRIENYQGRAGYIEVASV